MRCKDSLSLDAHYERLTQIDYYNDLSSSPIPSFVIQIASPTSEFTAHKWRVNSKRTDAHKRGRVSWLSRTVECSLGRRAPGVERPCSCSCSSSRARAPRPAGVEVTATGAAAGAAELPARDRPARPARCHQPIRHTYLLPPTPWYHPVSLRHCLTIFDVRHLALIEVKWRRPLLFQWT